MSRPASPLHPHPVTRHAPAGQIIDAAFAAAELPWHAINGDWPSPWAGAEFTSPAGSVRAYADDTDVIVVVFDAHGVELSRARFTRMPVAVIEAAVLAGVDLIRP